MPADFDVRIDTLSEFRDEIRLYRFAQERAMRDVQREIQEAHAFLDKAERAWQLREDEAARGLEECYWALQALHPVDCSGWEREHKWCQRRIAEIEYWQRELSKAESEFMPEYRKLEDHVKRRLPRAERFISDLVIALERAARRKVRM